jgi:hypothetical protein
MATSSKPPRERASPYHQTLQSIIVENVDPVAEMKAWYNVFLSSFDFFGDLQFDTDEEAQQYAPEVWKRVGHLFLERYKGTIQEQSGIVPWALKKFGPPPDA